MFFKKNVCTVASKNNDEFGFGTYALIKTRYLMITQLTRRSMIKPQRKILRVASKGSIVSI